MLGSVGCSGCNLGREAGVCDALEQLGTGVGWHRVFGCQFGWEVPLVCSVGSNVQWGRTGTGVCI